MPKAVATHTTNRRRPEEAATIGLMLLKASIQGLDDGLSPVEAKPVAPVLVGGAARALELA